MSSPFERQSDESGRVWYERLRALHSTFDKYISEAGSTMREEDKQAREAAAAEVDEEDPDYLPGFFPDGL